MARAVERQADDHDEIDPLMEEALGLVDPVVRRVARRRRLAPEDAEDLASGLRVKLLSHCGAVLRNFGGRSSLTTYLTVIVERMLLDDDVARWGKWRPSAAAKRAGTAAVTFERLMFRDGLPFEEACARAAISPAWAAEHLRSARRRAMRPAGSRHLVDLSAVREPLDSMTADHRVRAAAGAKLIERAVAALAEALASLDAEDSAILALHFRHDMSIASIARMLSLHGKALYPRINRLLRRLGEMLESRGLSKDCVLDALDVADVERPCLFGDEPVAAENAPRVRLYARRDDGGQRPTPASARRRIAAAS